MPGVQSKKIQSLEAHQLFLLIPHPEAVGYVEIEEAERLFVFGHKRDMREIAVVGDAGFQRVHGLFLFAEFGVEA